MSMPRSKFLKPQGHALESITAIKDRENTQSASFWGNPVCPTGVLSCQQVHYKYTQIMWIPCFICCLSLSKRKVKSQWGSPSWMRGIEVACICPGSSTWHHRIVQDGFHVDVNHCLISGVEVSNSSKTCFMDVKRNVYFFRQLLNFPNYPEKWPHCST